MNKTVIYIVGALIVLGGIWYFVFNKPAAVPSTTDNGTATTTSMEGNKQSLKALLMAANPQKCTVKEVTENSQSNGTVYIAGGKMRGDFTSLTSGKITVSHMILMNNTSYVWTDDMNQGFKMTIDPTTGQGAGTNGQGMDVNKENNYTCEPWTPDTASFVLPATITFKDMSAMMQGGAYGGSATGGAVTPPATSGYDMSAQCGACDSYGEPQKSACRAALKCK